MFRPLCCTSEEDELSKKITFECFLTVQTPLQTILGIQFFFQKFLKEINFSQYASHGKCVEYAKLNTTQNRKINAKFVRSTLNSTQNM